MTLTMNNSARQRKIKSYKHSAKKPSDCRTRVQRFTSWLLTAMQTVPLPQHFIQWHTSRLWPLARGNNNKSLSQYHYYHSGCLPATLRITLHGRQIGNWNTSVMEANCLSAGLVCISCKSHVHSSETWLTNNSHSEAKREIKMALWHALFTSYSLIIAHKHWWPHC